MRVLIVEDERDLATAIATGLKRQGFAVDLAFDGEQGLSLASSGAYDGIILDRMLPRMDGLAVCRALRQAGANVGILMLTAKDTVDDRVEGLNGGADDYLVKPFEFKELLARTHALTRRHTSEKRNVLTAKDLRVDLETAEVTRAGQPLALSRKEYMLLVYLLRHPRQLITHERLCTHAWDLESDANADLVRAHIKNLRRKVDTGFDEKLIHTVHGMGYRLEP
ncbi:MAG TPA: response regulator transcription factor [Oscillatoriaceae cyanobacterium]